METLELEKEKTINDMKLFVKRADKYKPLIEKWNISHTVISKKMGMNRCLLHIYMNNNIETDFKDDKFLVFLKVIRELKEDLSNILLDN